MLTAFLADAKSTIKARTNRDETGATAVEYGIMVAFLAVLIIVAVTFLSGGLSTTFNNVACQIQGKTYAAPAAGSPAGTAGSCTV